MKLLQQKEEATVIIEAGQPNAEYTFTKTYAKKPTIFLDMTNLSGVGTTNLATTLTAKDNAGYSIDIKVVSQDE